MLSVNQMNAQIKLTEMWKANNIHNYPLKIKTKGESEDSRVTRATTSGKLAESGKTEVIQSTYLSDASRAWNKAPESIIQCETVWKVKKEIKKFVRELPV